MEGKPQKIKQPEVVTVNSREFSAQEYFLLTFNAEPDEVSTRRERANARYCVLLAVMTCSVLLQFEFA